MPVALRQSVIAGVSMSLGHVLRPRWCRAWQYADDDHRPCISTLQMGMALALIARLLESLSILAYIGVALIGYTGVKMVYEAVHRLMSSGAAHGEYRESPEPLIRII